MILGTGKWLVRSAIAGLTFIFSIVIGKVVLTSLGDSFKALGILGFIFLCTFMGAIVMYMYDAHGMETAIYATISILIIHCSLWGVGYFETE